MARPSTDDWRLPAAAAGILILWLLYSARALLNPLWIVTLLLVVLYPVRGAPWARRLMLVGGVIALLWLIERLGGALAPFVIALVVAYFLDPAVDRLEARGLGRTLAILILTVPVFAFMAGAVLLVGPPLSREIARFVGQLPSLVQTAIEYLQPHIERLGTVDLEGLVRAHLPSLVDPLEGLVKRLPSGAAGVGRGVGAGLRLLSFLIVTPLATFYALRDIDHLKDELRTLLPPDSRLVEVLGEIDGLLGRYLRGQMVVCLTLGVATSLGLWILDVPYALLLGMATGVLNIVPIVGFWIALVAVVLVTLTMPAPFLSLIKVGVFYAIVQVIEGNILSPRIVGREVGLNPVLMILAIVVFSSLLGLTGVLVAVPAAAILALLYRRWRAAVTAG